MYVPEMGTGFRHDHKRGPRIKGFFLSDLSFSDVILGWTFITNCAEDLTT